MGEDAPRRVVSPRGRCCGLVRVSNAPYSKVYRAGTEPLPNALRRTDKITCLGVVVQFAETGDSGPYTWNKQLCCLCLSYTGGKREEVEFRSFQHYLDSRRESVVPPRDTTR